MPQHSRRSGIVADPITAPASHAWGPELVSPIHAVAPAVELSSDERRLYTVSALRMRDVVRWRDGSLMEGGRIVSRHGRAAGPLEPVPREAAVQDCVERCAGDRTGAHAGLRRWSWHGDGLIDR